MKTTLIPLTLAPPRFCYWINQTQDPELYGGYVPSMVEENIPGHSPMLGQGKCSRPWIWGKTLDEAEATAKAYNRDVLHLDERECFKIVASSMAVSRHQYCPLCGDELADCSCDPKQLSEYMAER